MKKNQSRSLLLASIRPSGLPIFCLLVFGVALHFACTETQSKQSSKLSWSKDFPVIGSQSSPRATDLNKDGVLDIVMGSGKNEFQESDMGILAFDGKSGELLWKQTAIDQVFGSASFCDVNGDSIKDVIIGGRSPQFKALDGKTGAVIWDYKHGKYANDPIMHYARFDFNNSVIVPDQNNDGVDDVLTINGGNPLAAAYSEVDRYPGVLILFDAKTGEVLAADTMPDRKESYMAPVSFFRPDDKENWVLFGTGGETISGKLYLANLTQLKSKKLGEAKVLATEKGHGFIAPPTLADLNKDGYLDIISISHGSTVFAINGKDYQVLWTRNFPGTECSNSFAAGYFTDDDNLDIFTFISKGTWPNSRGSVEVMLNGKDGKVEYMDSIGCTGFSSPVVYDMNNDGRDEVIISVNLFDCSVGYTGESPKTMENKVIAINFADKSVNTIDQAKGFKNIFCTPWIGDLDNDGYLDLIYCQCFHRSELISFVGLRIKRVDLPVKMKRKVVWGAYMGSQGNGIFGSKTPWIKSP